MMLILLLYCFAPSPHLTSAEHHQVCEQKRQIYSPSGLWSSLQSALWAAVISFFILLSWTYFICLHREVMELLWGTLKIMAQWHTLVQSFDEAMFKGDCKTDKQTNKKKSRTRRERFFMLSKIISCLRGICRQQSIFRPPKAVILWIYAHKCHNTE